MGGVMLVATIYVLFNILVDVLQAILDPRIKA
jgi:ABC-type dipeptide/oligopeptide/nickel transport system permease component